MSATQSLADVLPECLLPATFTATRLTLQPRPVEMHVGMHVGMPATASTSGSMPLTASMPSASPSALPLVSSLRPVHWPSNASKDSLHGGKTDRSEHRSPRRTDESESESCESESESESESEGSIKSSAKTRKHGLKASLRGQSVRSVRRAALQKLRPFYQVDGTGAALRTKSDKTDSSSSLCFYASTPTLAARKAFYGAVRAMRVDEPPLRIHVGDDAATLGHVEALRAQGRVTSTEAATYMAAWRARNGFASGSAPGSASGSPPDSEAVHIFLREHGAAGVPRHYTAWNAPILRPSPSMVRAAIVRRTVTHYEKPNQAKNQARGRAQAQVQGQAQGQAQGQGQRRKAQGTSAVAGSKRRRS